MQGFLLDTDVVSASRKREPEVLDWLQTNAAVDHWLSAITIGEIERGILQRRRKDAAAAAHLATWLQRLRDNYSGRLIEIDETIAIEWGRIVAMRTRGDADGLIAATAKVRGLTLVTRNVADFADTGVPIVNPWDA
jgi:predicted nucleic acid-binding protein